ncbi:MAG: Tn3 family transposase, partial [Casimicrobium sp.]
MASSFYRRFVGATRLPRNLSEEEIEQHFALPSEDLTEVKKRFNTESHLGAVLQLAVLRATGRPLDPFAPVPRALLHYFCGALGLSPIAIGSVRAMYKRRQTLNDHQQWARERSGMVSLSAEQQTALQVALHEIANGAASVDELVSAAERWLFDQKILFPSDRRIRDWARLAFATIEQAAVNAVKRELTTAQITMLLNAVFGKRSIQTEETVLDWLKNPSGKHGPSNLAESILKVTYLKGFGVDRWQLTDISNASLRAYAHKLASRAASESRRVQLDRRALEVVCFLKVALLDATDASLYRAARRFSDLLRQASTKVQNARLQSVRELEARDVAVRHIVHGNDTTAEQKIEALQALLPPLDTAAPPMTHAARVRYALARNTTAVSALLDSFRAFDIQGDASDKTVQHIELLRTLDSNESRDLPVGVGIDVIDRGWHVLLAEEDRGLALGALKASALASIRKGLRAGRLWIDHSWSYRNREDRLIPKAQWLQQRATLVSAMGLTLDPRRFLARLHAHLESGVAALSEAVSAGKIGIDADGVVRLEALKPRDVELDVSCARNAMFSIIGQAQFGDMIVEVDAHTGLSETLLGRRAKSAHELVTCYAALLAHGTENDAKGIAAMVPGLEPAHVTVTMRHLEGHNRLRRANERLVAFQRQHPISALWGSGEKASADMMALDASRHLFNARVDPRRRSFAVGLYTHVLDAYGVIYDQPIVLNERQVAAAVEGAEQYNMNNPDGVRLSLLSVDTHGYTYAGMSLAKCLGFDLCPRVRNVAERRLFLPRDLVLPDNLDGIALTRLSARKIIEGWDDLMRLVASIRSGRLTAKEALEKLGSAARGGAVHAAADQLGRLLRTLFLCDYFSNEAFRREILTLLNRGESVHHLQRAIYFGRIAHDRGRRPNELHA